MSCTITKFGQLTNWWCAEHVTQFRTCSRRCVRMFGRRSRVHWSLCDTFHVMLLQVMLASLRVLQAFRVPVEVLARLTALESLTLEDTVGNAAEAACGLSVLQRLTRLHLGHAQDAQLRIFAGCTGLRTLSLGGASMLVTWSCTLVYCLGSSRHCS